MIFPELVNTEHPEINYTKICLSALKRTPTSLRHTLYHIDRWDDLVSTAILAAVESHHGQLTANEAYNLSQRLCYKMLKDIGFCRVTNKAGKLEWLLREETYGIREEGEEYGFGNL